jgi:hypothetical protein
MGTEQQDAEAVEAADESTETTADAAVTDVPDQRVLTVAAHLRAWRETYGDDVMDAAVKMASDNEPVSAPSSDPRVAAAKRAAAGTAKSSAPVGRASSAQSKTKA